MAYWIASQALILTVRDRFPEGQGMDLFFNSFEGFNEEKIGR